MQLSSPLLPRTLSHLYFLRVISNVVHIGIEDEDGGETL